MKDIEFYNDDIKQTQVIRFKMGFMSKVKFLFTGVIEIPYYILNKIGGRK